MQLGIPRESNGHWKSSVARMLLSFIIYADALDTQCAQYGCIESLSQFSLPSPRVSRHLLPGKLRLPDELRQDAARGSAFHTDSLFKAAYYRTFCLSS